MGRKLIYEGFSMEEAVDAVANRLREIDLEMESSVPPIQSAFQTGLSLEENFERVSKQLNGFLKGYENK